MLIFFLIKIKTECPAEQKFETIIFKYFKVFDKCFKELQHYVMLLFVRSIIRDSYPLSMIIELCPQNIHAILMKLCPSEQNLVTNILKSI